MLALTVTLTSIKKNLHEFIVSLKQGKLKDKYDRNEKVFTKDVSEWE